MKEKTSAGAVKIEQAECNQARLRLLRRSLFYLKIEQAECNQARLKLLRRSLFYPKIEQAECNQARLRLLRRSLFYLKILSQKLHPNDILRKFATGMAVASDCHRTLRIKMTSITLPFDSRKSRKFTENPADLGTSKTTFSLRSLAGFLKRINQWIASDAHAYMAWAAPAVLLIRVVREPTWAKYRRVCSRFLFLLFATVPMTASAQTSSRTKSTTYQLKNLNKHHTMPQIIKSGGGFFSKGELLRINSSNNTIEVSTNEGRSWSPRCTNTSYGTFRDLLPVGREILAVTSRGLYASTNAARSFSPCCVNSSYGDFINLQEDGNTLLANTTKGLYYSTNGGRSWVRR